MIELMQDNNSFLLPVRLGSAGRVASGRWVGRMGVVPPVAYVRRGLADIATGGFRGSTFDPTSPGHLPSTYTAILVLAILRAPLDRLDIPGLTRFLGSCRQGDRYSPLPTDGFDFQADTRMTYCASVIADIIGTKIDPGLIDDCKTWEGGYAAKPGMEAQGALLTVACITS